MRLGIDIGTHTARAAYLDDSGAPRLVRLPDGESALPALARQTMHGLVVGAEAARALSGNTETTVSGCTRLMGRAGALPPQLLERLAYPVREVGGEAVCDLLYAEVRASEVYGRIASALVEAAQRETGRKVESVDLCLPASAEDRFRIQARAAAEAEGLTVRRLINQPAAALLALDTLAPSDRRWAPGHPAGWRRIAVVSCGGGSTEVSIAQRSGAGWRVLATAGDALLGGEDCTWAVARALNERFRRAAGLDVFAVGSSQLAAHGMRHASEETLRQLCVAPEATLVLDHGAGFARDLVATVRRAELDAWLRPAMDRIADLCRQALGAARVRPSGRANSRAAALSAASLDSAVLIGDWAFMPQVRSAVAGALGLSADALHTEDAERLAVLGAALATRQESATVWDVTPYPLGINCYFGDEELLSPIVPANTPIPTPRADEQGALTGEYWTRYPDQREVRIDVLQYRGPRDASPYGAGRVRPDECERLGSWQFDGLSPKRGECAAFTVTFAVDADGILQLQARETATGRTLSARVERGIGD
jgi:molecular chaperone DnaK (HSP70)